MNTTAAKTTEGSEMDERTWLGDRLRAFITCVEYHDILQLTLPWNRRHFKDVVVVTSCADTPTQELCKTIGVECFATDVFYEHGADFNKYAAVEQALTHYGRHGWLSVMDADIAFPLSIPEFRTKASCLYTPERRMCPTISGVPLEWAQYQLDPHSHTWAGYAHIFHESAPWLPQSLPWYEVDWRHAGGADSTFQANVPSNLKRRPPFQCLHLGIPRQNWCGRTTPMATGETPPESSQRGAIFQRYLRQRQAVPRFSNQDKYAHERISRTPSSSES